MSERSVVPSARAAVFTAVCVALALAAHRLMSGAAVSWWATLGAALVVFGLARAAAGAQRGLGSITALMLGAQAGLHVWFDAAQLTTASTPACAPMPGMPGMGRMAGVCGALGAHASLSAVLHATPAMLAAHTLAALVAAWWLWRGEAALFGLVRLLRVRLADWAWLLWALCAVRCVAGGCRPRACGAGGRGPRTLRLVVLRFQVVRRGPPRGVVSVL
jgi:hypothetical protein